MKPHFLCPFVTFKFILYLTLWNITFHPLKNNFFKEAGLSSFVEYFGKFGSKCIDDEFIEFTYHSPATGGLKKIWGGEFFLSAGNS